MDQSTASIKPSDVLRAAARRCERYGFNIRLGDSYESCGCFVHHLAGADRQLKSPIETFSTALGILGSVVDSSAPERTPGEAWTDFSERALGEHGWIDAPKRDAVAAFEIAADIAEAEGQ
jgi:hypothetical protein